MKKISDPYINNIVKSLVPKNILDIEGLVIAGGFATALYYLYVNGPSWIKDNPNVIYQKMSDIDYWILKGSQADQLLNKWLKINENGKLLFVPHDDEDVSNFFSSILNLKFLRATRFSLTGSAFNIKHQIIRKESYVDIENIVDGFDINICKVAWSNDALYIHEDAEMDFMFRSLTLNKDLEKEPHFFQRYWSVKRLFKYYTRYGFEPDKKTTLTIHKILQEVIEFYESPVIEKVKHFNIENLKSSYAFPLVLKREKVFEALESKEVDWNRGEHIIDKDPFDPYNPKNSDHEYWRIERHCENIIFTCIPLFLNFHECNSVLATILLSSNTPFIRKEVEKYLNLGGSSSVTKVQKIIIDDQIWRS